MPHIIRCSITADKQMEKVDDGAEVVPSNCLDQLLCQAKRVDRRHPTGSSWKRTPYFAPMSQIRAIFFAVSAITSSSERPPEPAVERVGCNHSPTAAQPQTAFLFLPVYSAPHHRPFAQHWRYH